MIHGWCDRGTGWLLCLMVVFSPWAFGTTQDWAIQVMNSGGYALGVLLGAKWLLRRTGRWQPPMWGRKDGQSPSRTWISRGLATSTILIVGYCLVSAANARSTFVPTEYRFNYHDCLTWLPHSYDSVLGWQAFWNYLALACGFWAVRDWLLVKSKKDLAQLQPYEVEAVRRGYALPTRLRVLAWVISLNGALLAAEGLVQHTVGDGRLLWIITPSINKSPDAQFGPYAYRSNAAQYFLLAWPFALGLWWVLRANARWTTRKALTYRNLLPCIFLIALAPLVSLSRAGTIIGSVSLAIALFIVAKAEYRSGRKRLPGMVLLLGLALLLAGLMEWQHLDNRFHERTLDSYRHVIWQNSWEIAKEHPVFGTGPGTFESVYHLYRTEVNSIWFAAAHNDWLETLLTFGIVGSVPIVGGLLLLLGRWWVPGGIAVHRLFMLMIYLALGSCFVYAIVDFPLQVYSVLFLVVLECSVLSCLGRTSR
jgi:O-antigen ligase